MHISLKVVKEKLFHLLVDEEGATTVEYAVIVTALILGLVAIIYTLANFEGDGVAQQAFEAVGNQAGQFGKIVE